MSAALIAQLLVTFGPQAIDLIQKLIEVWNKPSLTVEEVTSICDLAKKSYDQYIAEGKPPTTPIVSAANPPAL